MVGQPCFIPSPNVLGEFGAPHGATEYAGETYRHSAFGL